MNVKYIEGDTIAACATAPGEGGVAIVRVSGPDAEGMMRRFFKKLPERIESHRMYYGHIVGAGAREEALCVLMRAPRSYTREDVCEFNIHGGGDFGGGRVMRVSGDGFKRRVKRLRRNHGPDSGRRRN